MHAGPVTPIGVTELVRESGRVLLTSAESGGMAVDRIEAGLAGIPRSGAAGMGTSKATAVLLGLGAASGLGTVPETLQSGHSIRGGPAASATPRPLPQQCSAALKQTYLGRVRLPGRLQKTFRA
jgi:hypothetical protein